MLTVLLIAMAYLIGSISFAVVASKLYGLPDPHSYGSGNPGATNVLRTGNRTAAALTLAGDGFKGWCALWLAQKFAPATADAALTVALAALAVFLGHLYPIFHRFAGGKGVATAAGMMFGIDWRLGAAVLAVWIVTALLFRMSSLAALVAATCAVPLGLLLLGSRPVVWMLVPIALLLFWRHRGNVRKLWLGEETRIGR